MTTAGVSLEQRKAINFDPKHLLVPALLCIWLLPFITFSQPDDWRISRFGTAPILPPTVLKAMKFFGRGGTIGLMGFCLLSVWRHEKRGRAVGIMIPLLMFGIYGMSSTLWSPLRTISLMQSATFVMLLMLSTYVGIIWRSDADTERIVKHLGLAIFSLSVVLVLLHFGMPRSGSLTKEASGVLHSTNAGAAGGLCVILTLAARLLWKSPWARWWPIIISVEVAMMLIAGNRLSVVVTVITAALFLSFAMHRAVAALCVFLMTTLVAGYFIVDPGLELVESGAKHVGIYAKQGQTRTQISSLSGRAEMWTKMWDSYLKSPVIGHGYFVTTKKGRIFVWGEWGNWTAHNIALQTLVTTGVVGLSLLTIGLLTLLAGVFSGLRVLDNINNSALLLFTLSVWYFGWGFLNSSFIGPLQPEAVVFALMVGVSAGIGSSAHHEIDLQRREARLAKRENPLAEEPT